MRIAHLLSGGVDSSVALKLLIDAGHDVTCFYIKIWLEDELASLGACPWEDDLKHCEKTCSLLGVPLRIINLQKEYHERVVSYALAEIKAGRTPNPDMLCNQTIKFGAFIDAISKGDGTSGAGFDKVSSGHYAAVEKVEGVWMLRRNPDPVKDQTYFLARLSQEQLSKAMFPLSDLTKQEVRALARDWKLPAAERKDSQGICFLGKIPYDDFIKAHLGTRTGEFVDADSGKLLGHHRGYWFFTIGQRHGITLGNGPWYVVRKDIEENKVFISNQYKEPEKRRDDFVVTDVRWAADVPDIGAPLYCKLRHGPTLYECAITPLDKKSTTRLRVRIHGNDQGLAPGQYCVFYDGEYCVGAGVIE